MTFGVMLSQLLSGLGQTCLIFALTLIFSLPLGLAVCAGRMSKFAPFGKLVKNKKDCPKFLKALGEAKPIRAIFSFFIAILRGTPLMLQLLVVCYGPYYLFKVNLSSSWKFFALIIGFVINYSAYFAEIYRAGIESIPVGQSEAAQTLGYSKAQTFFKIILPQMVKRTLPPVTNEVITLVKDTSLAFVLTHDEMFTIAKRISAAKTTFTPLLIAGLFYFVFNAIVAFVMTKIENSMKYYE
ncbi:MAG: amino acid ABC transporter permease [Oscillospiraceae bacterium]|nr:amino acid ABC transporter permease [Oscillospiraceae bacterium]